MYQKIKKKIIPSAKLSDTLDHTFIISNIFCHWGSITGSCCHVQKRLNNFNFEYSIFLPKVQHTNYFTLLYVRKHEYTINICTNNLLYLTPPKKEEKDHPRLIFSYYVCFVNRKTKAIMRIAI